jgi:hypothetical protein
VSKLSGVRVKLRFEILAPRSLGHPDDALLEARVPWDCPVVANGKLYLRDQDVLLCYDVKAK